MSLLGRQTALIALATAGVLAVMAAANAATPTPAPTVTGLYGAAFAMDSKNNYQVGWTVNQRVAHRFRAGTTSQLTSIALNQRGGPGYSLGTGGLLHVELQEDRNGTPSGTTLASLTISPGNPDGHWENHGTYRFASPATLAEGAIYHVVMSNPDASSATNYISVNEAYQYLATTPRQPSFRDDFAVLYDRGSGWEVLPHDTPVMDLGYADGHHDGNAYASVVADYASVVSGSRMVRERFRISGASRSVTTAGVRVKRIDGNGLLTFRLEAADGTVLAERGVTPSRIPRSTVPSPVDENSWDETSLGGGRWVEVSFPAVVLRTSSTYALRIATDDDTTYAVVPIREVDDADPPWGAYAFRDGRAQRTSDGTSWADVYAYGNLDLQFYLR